MFKIIESVRQTGLIYVSDMCSHSITILRLLQNLHYTILIALAYECFENNRRMMGFHDNRSDIQKLFRSKRDKIGFDVQIP